MTEQEKIRNAQREYKRKWRLKNPGKEQAYAKKYWLKKAKECEEKENA